MRHRQVRSETRRLSVGQVGPEADAVRETSVSIMKFKRSGTLAVVAIALVAAAIGVGHPRDVSEPLLGAEWQCTRTAFIVTTCSESGERTR